jgi:transposase-like protein
MPWKEHDVREERFRFIEDWRSEDWTMAELCRHYEVTRATGYKWLSRYEEGGLDGLADQSRAPLRHPNELPVAVEDLVVEMRAKHPTWGAPKIRAWMAANYARLKLPAESTIGAILKRHGLTVPRRARRPRSIR